MRMERRDVLKLAACACCAGTLGRAAAEEKKAVAPRVGLQLYAVRGEFEKDPTATIKKAAALGYQGVEFWGYGGTPTVYKDAKPKDVRALLDSLGIACCGIHMAPGAILEDKLPTTIDVNKTLGNKFLIVAAAADQMRAPDSIARFAEALNKAAEKAAAHGMRVGYHCHGFDFQKFDGRTGWDILFSATKPEVVMQVDTGNCAGGGGDPVAILKKFPGRATTLHVREFANAPLVKDNAVWKEIFALCAVKPRTEWFIVEQGGENGLGFDDVKRCRESLKAMLSGDSH